MATCHLAEWVTAPTRTARFAAPAPHPRPRLATPAPPRPRGLVAVRSRGRHENEGLKYYFVHLPATASLRALVRSWRINGGLSSNIGTEELKSELGLDHFEGRSYPGWHHHVVLTAVAHAYHPARAHATPAGADAPRSRQRGPSSKKSSRPCCLRPSPDTCTGWKRPKRKLQLRI